MQDHLVQAEDRKISFRGRIIGFGSSQALDKDRWAEVTLYRTEAGNYIVAGVGRSQRPGETDRHWAHSSGTPEGAIEALYLYDADEVKYMPNFAKRALAEAAREDEAIRSAMSEFTEHVA